MLHEALSGLGPLFGKGCSLLDQLLNSPDLRQRTLGPFLPSPEDGVYSLRILCSMILNEIDVMICSLISRDINPLHEFGHTFELLSDTGKINKLLDVARAEYL